ncbi:MAG: four helix bundle protein [Bacteroidales bacterium]|nr:four helix bundle protein [Bacteroidales bacterium]
MELKDLEVYKIAMQIGELTWEFVNTWGHFAKTTIGTQWVDAADSIAANISEGEGRYNFSGSQAVLLFCQRFLI